MPRGETLKRTRKLYELCLEKGYLRTWTDSLANPDRMLEFLSDDLNRLTMQEIDVPETKQKPATDKRGIYMFETKCIFILARSLGWPLRWKLSLSRESRNRMIRFIEERTGRKFTLPKIITKAKVDVQKTFRDNNPDER